MEHAPSLEQRIAARISTTRAAQGLTLDALSERSGVSRAMISKIERGEASPTASLLAKLANALGFGLSAFFEEDAVPPQKSGPLLRHCDQTTWRDPDTGYIRRNVSPRGFNTGMEIVAVTLPPGKKVFFDNAAPLPLSQFVWLHKGELTMTCDGEKHRMQPGDCLHMRLEKPVIFHNRGTKPAEYAVVIETPRLAPMRDMK